MKSIVLRPTEEGKRFYISYVESEAKSLFAEFFDDLAPLSDEKLLIVSRAIENLNSKLEKDTEKELVQF